MDTITFTNAQVRSVSVTYDWEQRRLAGWPDSGAVGSPTTSGDCFWGSDLSGYLQGAGGVSGLVAVSIGGQFYFPGYDNNGNVIGYWNEAGALVAEYAYDAFGNTIASSGAMTDVFPHRFSTKYFDSETGLYYYGYRYYSPILGRWISRDALEEFGSPNLQAFCKNGPSFTIDGLARHPFRLRRIFPFPSLAHSMKF